MIMNFFHGRSLVTVLSAPNYCGQLDSAGILHHFIALLQEITGWEPSDRGVSYRYGPDIVDAFLAKNNLSLIVRAHQVVEDGYEFFHDRSLVTLFSAPNYCGQFDNAGALMMVKEDLTCSFSILAVSSFIPLQWLAKVK